VQILGLNRVFIVFMGICVVNRFVFRTFDGQFNAIARETKPKRRVDFLKKKNR
jgi:hypothetical protein